MELQSVATWAVERLKSAQKSGCGRHSVACHGICIACVRAKTCVAFAARPAARALRSAVSGRGWEVAEIRVAVALAESRDYLHTSCERQIPLLLHRDSHLTFCTLRVAARSCSCWSARVCSSPSSAIGHGSRSLAARVTTQLVVWNRLVIASNLPGREQHALLRTLAYIRRPRHASRGSTQHMSAARTIIPSV